MPRPPRRKRQETADLTTSPPDTLPSAHRIARVVRPAGNNLYHVEFAPPSATPTRQANGSTTAYTDTAADTGLAEQSSTHGGGGSIAEGGLAELNPRFRSTIFVKRGTFVVVDTEALAERENKLVGEIVNVVREERLWMKCAWWPDVWRKRREVDLPGSDGEESEGDVDGEAS